jgi:GntR family transcriptional regulator/MocR family aminotransferase
VTSQIGSATRVAAGARPAPAASLPEPVSPPRLIADFRSGVPDLGSFPRDDWAWATREACTGFAQGLNLVLRALTPLGVRCAALEDPGHGDLATSDSARSARAAGMDVMQVPVDDLGLDVSALEASGARVVVVTPAHQAPTGVVLAAMRRHALVEWAARNDGFVVEDDYDSEFRYDRQPVGVLQGLAPDRVFTIGTVSKSLAPAVRLRRRPGSASRALSREC